MNSSNPTPDQPTGMNELQEALSKLVDDVHLANYARDNGITPAYSTVEAEAAVQQLVEQCLPNSQNGTGRVFNGNLTGSAMTSGYRQAVDDIRHNFQQAGLLRGDEVPEERTRTTRLEFEGKPGQPNRTYKIEKDEWGDPERGEGEYYEL